MIHNCNNSLKTQTFNLQLIQFFNQYFQQHLSKDFNFLRLLINNYTNHSHCLKIIHPFIANLFVTLDQAISKNFKIFIDDRSILAKYHQLLALRVFILLNNFLKYYQLF